MQEFIVVIINGVGESGKDTFVNLCAEHATVFNLSTVDKVKDVATLFGWQGDKTPEDRKLLSDLKDAWTKYNNGPFHEFLYIAESPKRSKN